MEYKNLLDLAVSVTELILFEQWLDQLAQHHQPLVAEIKTLPTVGQLRLYREVMSNVHR